MTANFIGMKPLAKLVSALASAETKLNASRAIIVAHIKQGIEVFNNDRVAFKAALKIELHAQPQWTIDKDADKETRARVSNNASKQAERLINEAVTGSYKTDADKQAALKAKEKAKDDARIAQEVKRGAYNKLPSAGPTPAPVTLANAASKDETRAEILSESIVTKYVKKFLNTASSCVNAARHKVREFDGEKYIAVNDKSLVAVFNLVDSLQDLYCHGKGQSEFETALRKITLELQK
jgi:hypothetical protein